MPEDCPVIAKDLISKLLVINPLERLGAIEMEHLKQHPFFEGVDFSCIYSEDPPLQEKQKKLSMQQQKELKFLPKREIKSKIDEKHKQPLSCFADRVLSQNSVTI